MEPFTMIYPGEHGFDDDMPELEDIPHARPMDFNEAVIAVYSPTKAEKEDADISLTQAANSLFIRRAPVVVYDDVPEERGFFQRVKNSLSRAFDSLLGRNPKRPDFLVGQYTGGQNDVTPEEAVMLGLAGFSGLGCGILVNKFIVTMVPLVAAGLVVYYICKTYDKLPDWSVTEQQLNMAATFIVETVGEERLHEWYCYLQDMYATLANLVIHNSKFTISFVTGMVCGLVFF